MRDRPLTAVVTGASRGLGQAIALELLASPDTVAGLAARDPDTVSDLLKRTKPGRAFLLALDYQRTDTITAAVAECAKHIQYLDLLINNAGTTTAAGYPQEASKGPMTYLEAGALLDVFATNTVGPVMTSQAFLPLLRKAAAPIIVNMSTSWASVANATGNSFAYGLSKAALNMATRKMSMTIPGCAVVAVDPGWVRTDMGGPDAPAKPAEAAAALLALLRDKGQSLNGRFINLRGEDLAW
jgi:NAD(P)-dependent dehydrogenase (short-subunit alcohol dehydrogenase family)